MNTTEQCCAAHREQVVEKHLLDDACTQLDEQTTLLTIVLTCWYYMIRCDQLQHCAPITAVTAC